MKGKKVDNQFVSNFISSCIKNGIESQDEIITHAKALVKDIDAEIKKVEEQKVLRSKLLDVISTFERSSKSSNIEEIKILSFYKIQNPHICQYICEKLKNRVVKIESLKNKQISVEDMMFCIKQLTEHKVISKIEDQLLRGDAFDDYMKFILRETV